MKISSVISLLKRHWLLVLIMILATWLRTHDLQTKSIFFGDAARDLLVARESVLSGHIPLLGIPSSIPRFKQGPLTIWLEMIIYLVATENLYVYSLFFALLSILAIIAVYEFSALYLSERTGVLSALLIAASPLAVAQGRMVYHTNPIPLMLVLYFFGLMQLWQGRKWGVFIATLTWALLFQFELALLPLLLLVPYVIWRTRRTIRLTVDDGLKFFAGMGIGLLPQILFDLRNGFAQLGGFAAWVGYRIASALGLIGDHVISPNSLSRAAGQFWLYLGRIVSVDDLLIKVVIIGLWLMALAWAARALIMRKLTPGAEIVTLATLLLTTGFLIHSSPSEAYFPPYIVLLPLLLSIFIFKLRKSVARVMILVLVVVSAVNTWQIIQSSFFVSTNQAFSYGASTKEQRLIVQHISDVSSGEYAFATTSPAGIFPSYFDNLRWMALEIGESETKTASVYYVESKDSALASYPNIFKIVFPTVDVYYLP